MLKIVHIAEKLLSEIRQINRQEQEAHGGGAGMPSEKQTVNVLLVEDNANDAELSSRALRAAGAFSGTAIEVTIARDGEKAIELLERSKNPLLPDYQLVFLDMGLPGKKQGLDVLKVIHQKFPNLHVVIVSGSMTVETLEEVQKLHAYIGFVRKPLEEVNVTEIIEKHRY